MARMISYTMIMLSGMITVLVVIKPAADAVAQSLYQSSACISKPSVANCHG